MKPTLHYTTAPKKLRATPDRAFSLKALIAILVALVYAMSASA